MLWYLYQIVAQKVVRSCEGKQVISENKFAISELPTPISTIICSCGLKTRLLLYIFITEAKTIPIILKKAHRVGRYQPLLCLMCLMDNV